MTTADGRPVVGGRVAVIGADPQGLMMLKALREDGYNVTAYERRDRVGGLWAYTENTSYTTALQSTRANIRKFTCASRTTQFHIADTDEGPDAAACRSGLIGYNTHMTPQELQEFMQESNAKYFDLLKDISFCREVQEYPAERRTWLLDIESTEDGKSETVQYGKVAFCTGPQHKAVAPTFEDQDKF
ncbi:dimethylaniline monooxygenase 2 [Naviculisporaceae sp. PSN 640]